MRIVERLEGRCVLDGEHQIHGLVGGTLTAARGARIALFGVVGGDMRVDDGAEVDLHGVVAGSVFTRGTLRVTSTGVIRGSLYCGRTGRVELIDGAVIRRGQKPLVEVAP